MKTMYNIQTQLFKGFRESRDIRLIRLKSMGDIPTDNQYREYMTMGLHLPRQSGVTTSVMLEYRNVNVLHIAGNSDVLDTAMGVIDKLGDVDYILGYKHAERVVDGLDPSRNLYCSDFYRDFFDDVDPGSHTAVVIHDYVSYFSRSTKQSLIINAIRTGLPTHNPDILFVG